MLEKIPSAGDLGYNLLRKYELESQKQGSRHDF